MIIPIPNRNIAFALLFLLVFVIYSNTFHCSWQFDDTTNILDNSKLHITNLSWESIKGSFYAATNGKNTLYRPVSCFTFALNWYFGQDNVTGYHIVNVTIHVLTAWMLFLTISRIFQTPNIRERYTENDIFFIALLATCLWAINPIQTQAVTYIVQRMTSLSALFYISGLYFYISGRIYYTCFRQKAYFFFMCMTSFVLAMGSKEHTITLPLVLFLSEIAFFQNLGDPEIRKFLFRLSVAVTITAIISTLLLFYITIEGYTDFLNLYQTRSFTLTERLLTQFRVIIFYLGLMVYPVAPRLSLIHDIEISTSLIHPWTTLPAIFLVFFLIALGIWLLRHHPVSGFSILFFFVTHAVESTILPLEMIFEHRNYLPSMFLFLPAASGIKWILDYYRLKKKEMYILLGIFMTFLLTGLGTGTYIRNMVWFSEKTMWTDVAEKYPELGRPWQYLGNYYMKTGNLDAALNLFYKSLNLKFQTPGYSHMVSFNNIGNIYDSRHEYDKAIHFYKEALSAISSLPNIRYNLALTTMSSGDWRTALEEVEQLLVMDEKNSYKHLVLKGIILINIDKVEDALSFFKKAFKLNPDGYKAIFYMGIALSFSEKFNTSEHFLLRAYEMSPDVYPALWLVENSRRAGDAEKTRKYIDRLLDTYTFPAIKKRFNEIIADNLLITPPPDQLIPAIRQRAEERLTTWSAEFTKQAEAPPVGTD